MKFKVREGFILRRIDLVDNGSGKKVPQEKVHYPNQTVDLTEDQAKDHLHQLEPADDKATRFCESRFVPEPEVPQGGYTAEKVQDIVNAAVKAALTAFQTAQAASNKGAQAGA